MDNCGKCTLSGQPTKGRGADRPKLIFVGEAPGAEEEKQGVPFVGKAGKILMSILNYLNIPEDEYYITNVCLCRPPENRTPTKIEIAQCLPRLSEEIKARPSAFVVALGKTPADALFGLKNMKNHRGKVVTVGGITGLATYHPAATLYAKGDTLFPYILADIEKAYQTACYGPPDEEVLTTEVFIIKTEQDMRLLINRLYNLPKETIVAYDWETTGLSPLWDVGFCLGLSWKEGTAAVIPMHFVRKWAVDLNITLSACRLVGFNAASFDASWNEKYKLPTKVEFDPMLWHYLIDERPQQRSLENLTSFFLGAPCYEAEMLASYKVSKKDMITTIPEDEVYTYCGKDVDWTLRLSNYFSNSVAREPELMNLYADLLSPAAEAFRDIKRTGVWVDREALQTVEEAMVETIVSQLDELRTITGDNEFNPNSHPQVQKFIWDVLGLKEPEIYNRKERSADKETIIQLLEKYPDHSFLSALQHYKETYTLYSRYIKSLPDYIEPDNRVRANYHFDRTETGRLSTTSPAIHQIPREGTIRRIFSAPPGHVLVQADYEQVEIRMAAHVAQDTALSDFLTSGADFHSSMASQAFGVLLEDVSIEQRQAAKAVSFGLLYLMSDKGLIVKTGLPKNEAIDFIRRYKALMPGVQRWIEDIKAAIRVEQYIVSPFGRRRRFPLVTPGNLEGLYREGVNFPIQSGASDLTLSAVVKLNHYFKQYYPEAKIVIMVHDSIVVECPEVIATDVASMVKRVMEDVPLDASTPFPVEIKIGKRWGESE